MPNCKRPPHFPPHCGCPVGRNSTWPIKKPKPKPNPSGGK